MSWPFHCSAWEHFASVWGAVGVLRGLHEEPAPPAGEEFAEPSEADRRSVAGRPAPQIKVPYSFTSADEAAEARVLADLADLITSRRLAPWEAADLLFNRTIEIGESDAYLA